MKLSICLSVIISLLFNCKNYEIEYNNDLPNESEKAVIDIHLGNSKNLLTFLNNFENDSVSVYSDSISIFKGTLTTDANLGAARGMEILRTVKYLNIKINNELEIKIENKYNYRFIYIFRKEKEKKKYKILYTNKFIRLT